MANCQFGYSFDILTFTYYLNHLSLVQGYFSIWLAPTSIHLACTLELTQIYLHLNSPLLSVVFLTSLGQF